jgi:hypothetical protein
VSEWKRIHSLTLVATAERSTMGLGTWALLSAHLGRPDGPGGRISDCFSPTGETPVPPLPAVPGGMGVSPMSGN